MEQDQDPPGMFPPVTCVKWSELISKDGSATSKFCREMRRSGIAVIEMDDESILDVFRECENASLSYFKESSSEEKNSLKMGTDSSRDWGYVKMEGVKEFWQMRDGAGSPRHPWPSLGAQFHRCCRRIGCESLRALARGMDVNEDMLCEALVDREDVDLSSSIFRFFRYFAGAFDEGCAVHTDIGVITVIPATRVPALITLDETTLRWRHYEDDLPKNSVMILCGETLECATGSFYRAVVHRVRRLAFDEPDRTSLVYLMRGRPDAVLDPNALKSPMLQGGHYPEPITVARFMREKYLTKRSANFVESGQGLPGANLKGEEVTEKEVEEWKKLDKY